MRGYAEPGKEAVSGLRQWGQIGVLTPVRVDDTGLGFDNAMLAAMLLF